MQLVFKEHVQLIAFQKLKDLKTGEVLYEKAYMSPRPPPKISLKHEWNRQAKFFQPTNPTNPIQTPNQSVIDRGNLRTKNVFFWIKEKRPVPTRSMKNVCTKNLILQIDRGNLRDCLKTFVVMHAHDGTGEPVEPSSSSTHIVKEQFVPEENRDIASFNADNEFNRAINEENIDFNIPGLPNSTVKRSHGVNVQNLIQKIENHPQRQALQNDLQQHR